MWISGKSPSHFVVAATLVVALSVCTLLRFLNCNAQEGQFTPPITPGGPEGGDNVPDMLGLGKEVIVDRMKVLYQKVDADNNGSLSETEIRDWLMQIRTAVQARQVAVEVQAIDKDKNGVITIVELKSAYGSTEDASSDQMKEVETRFKIVDKNKDGSLDKDELALLMDPSGDPELLRLETEEILLSQDKNKDGKITISEFSEGEGSGEDQQELEREFKLYDTDGDGLIDRDEIQKVIADPHQHEVDSGIKELSEFFVDGSISFEKWEANVEKIAISPATDHGELLRLPEDYPGLELPYSNVEKEALEDREEL